MNDTPSKGLLALRKSNSAPERISVDGEMFFFRKLTISMEDELDAIVRENQNTDLKPPADLSPEASAEEIKAFQSALLTYRQEAERSFRRLTAKIMAYVLVDETGKAFFSPDDDIYGLLNNVYAAKFYKAYLKFRQGSEATPAAAESRFPA